MLPSPVCSVWAGWSLRSACSSWLACREVFVDCLRCPKHLTRLSTKCAQKVWVPGFITQRARKFTDDLAAFAMNRFNVPRQGLECKIDHGYGFGGSLPPRCGTGICREAVGARTPGVSQVTCLAPCGDLAPNNCRDYLGMLNMRERGGS